METHWASDQADACGRVDLRKSMSLIHEIKSRVFLLWVLRRHSLLTFNIVQVQQTQTSSTKSVSHWRPRLSTVALHEETHNNCVFLSGRVASKAFFKDAAKGLAMSWNGASALPLGCRSQLKVMKP